MPGLSAIQASDGYDRSTFSDAVRTSPLQRDSSGRVQSTVVSDTMVGFCTYPEYPLRIAENEDYVALFEGRIYRPNEPRQEDLYSLAKLLFECPNLEKISKWIASADGEFLLMFIDKRTGEIAVLNDWRAALPTYYTDDGRLVLSREVKTLRTYLANRGDSRNLDKLGVAQFLLFRHTLGNRTIYDGVKRLPPGSLLRATDGDVTVHSTHALDFGDKTHRTTSVASNASELATLFTKACHRRAGDENENLVSLSGGLDSRAIATAFDHNDDPFVATTHTSTTPADVEIAKEIAAELDVPWECYQVADSTTDRSILLSMKQGTLSLQQSNGLDYYRQLSDEHGRASVLFDGGGGDKALPDLGRKRMQNDSLVSDLIDTRALSSVDDVAKITSVSHTRIVDSIKERIDSYPETDKSAKREHFLIRERAFNWINESIDMKRYYLWPIAPFYGKQFFEYAMGCPSGQKRDKRLQAAFLDKLSPQVRSIRDENTGDVIGTKRWTSSQIKRRVRRFVSGRPRLRAYAIWMLSILGQRQDPIYTTETAERIGDQIDTYPVIGQHLSEKAINNFVRTAEHRPESAQQNLFTITSLLVKSELAAHDSPPKLNIVVN